MPARYSGRMPTEEEIEAARTPKGGFTRAQLAAWGVPWPPPKGWKRTLLGKNQLGKQKKDQPPVVPHPGRPLTEADIEAGRSVGGGFTRAQLAEWGVPWPAPRGWRKGLVERRKVEPLGKRLTEQELEAGKTPAGGYTREQLAAWGVPWPAPKGWKVALLKGIDPARLVKN